MHLPPHYVYVSSMILKVNISYFPKELHVICLCNGDALCFLSSRNWIFKQHTD